MSDEELQKKMHDAQVEIDNISYELSNLIKNKDSIPTEEYQASEAELKELLAKETKNLNDYRIALEAPKEEVRVEESKLEGLAKEDQDKVQQDIVKARQELELVQKEFEKYTKLMQDTYKYTNDRLTNGPLSDEALKETYDDYYAAMYSNEAVWNDYKSRVAKLERKIKRLERKSKQIEEDVLVASNLEIEYSEYKEIMKTLKSRKRLTEILEQKGLGDIVHKRGGHSKKEKELLQEAKNQIFSEILNVMETNKELSILDAINILYYPNQVVTMKEEARNLPVPIEMYQNILSNLQAMPQAVQQAEEKPKVKTKETPKAPVGIPRSEVVFNGVVPERIIYESRNMTEDEYIIDQFERFTGKKYDPEIHEIIKNHDASGVMSDDNVYSTYDIIEKQRVEEPVEETIVNEQPELPGQVIGDIPALPGETIDGRRVGYGDDDQAPLRLPAGRDDELDSNDIANAIDEEMDNVDVEVPEDDLSIADIDNDISNVIDDIDLDEEDKKDNDEDNETQIDSGEEDKDDDGLVAVDGPEDNVGEVDQEEEEKGPKPINRERPIGLREIINGKICKDLNIERKDASKYKWKNARVVKSFWDDLKSNGVLYNIVHIAPGILKLAGSAVMKLARGIFKTKKSVDLVAEMKKRIDGLSPEELETLFRSYRGGYIVQEGYPQIVNVVIEEKMNEYILGKVNALNEEMTAAYRIVFTTYKQITALDEKLRDSNLDKATRDKLKAARREMLATAAANCMDIRAMQEQARELLSGGLHGMSEDMKAAASKMNIVGIRFAKTYDYDNELEDRLEKAQTQYLDGIEKGDDQAVLSGFMQEEKLLAAHTSEDMSIFGIRSTGKKHYFPLAEMLDYRPDPFIRDLFTTIAVTSAAISAVNAIRVNAEQQRILEAHQDEIVRVNGQNAQTMSQVNQTGAEIAGKRDVFSEGMRSQIEQNVLSRSNVHERASLDQTNWDIGSDPYHILDHARHDAAHQFYTDTYTQMSDVSTRLANGTITDAQALQELANIATQSHKTFTDTVADLLQVTKDYAAAHPQHDLTAVVGTMEYFAKNPDIISQMNQGMVDVTNLGEGLIGLTAEQATMIQSLPSDLATALVAAASATALAYNVSRDMERKYAKRSHRNEVTDMMDELVEEDEKQLEEQEKEEEQEKVV